MDGLLCLKWNNHSSSLLRKLSLIYEKEAYCDATIACQGRFFPAHRFVLSICSEYFEEIFDRTQCKHPFIIIKDIEPLELEALLCYMYNGEVNVLQETLPGLIKAAEVLKIKGLAVPEDNLPQESERVAETKKRTNSSSSDLHSKVSKRPRTTSDQDSTNDLNKVNSDSNFDMQNQCEDDKIASPIMSNSDINSLDAVRSTQDSVEVKIKTETLSFEESQNNADNALEPHKTSNSLASIDTSSSAFTSPDFDSTEALLSLREDVAYVKNEEDNAQCSSWDDSGNRISNSGNTKERSIKEGLLPDQTSVTLWGSLIPADPLRDCFHCPFCLFTCAIMGKLQDHFKMRHADEMIMNKIPYFCSLCSFTCHSADFLQKHTQVDHVSDPKRFVCQFCSYETMRFSDFKRHVMIHTGEKPFACSVCPYKATQKVTLDKHMSRHTHADSGGPSLEGSGAVKM